MAEKSQMEQHLQNSVYGTPLVHPDEQRHYLGTFRERVSLAMTIAEVTNAQNVRAFTREINAHPDLQVIFNGHIDQSDLAPYLKATGQHNLKFTIRQDDFYGHQTTDLGLVVASDHAIDQNPISLTAKYPTTPAKTQATPPAKQPGWLARLFGHH